MEWPDSVHVDTLSTHKTARKLRPRNPEGIDKRYSAGQREEYRRKQRDAHPFVPTGVVLHAGERGAAVLKSFREEEVGKRRGGKQRVPRQRWDWEFANATRPERSHKFSEEVAVFYPPTINVPETAPAVRASASEIFARARGLDQRRPVTESRCNGKQKAREGSGSSDGTGTPAEDGAVVKEDTAAGGSKDAGTQSQQDEEDEQPIPAAQQQPATASTLIPGDEDADMTVVRDGTPPEDPTPSPPAIQIADNRQPLATIRYLTKVKSGKNLGFDEFELHYVVFPMGEHGNELNISVFKTYPETKKQSTRMPHFVPTAQPDFVCKDRILQVSVSNKRRAPYQFICIAVRTETLIYYLLVTPLAPTPFPIRQSGGIPVVRVELLSLVDSVGLEGGRAVDIAMHPEQFQRCLIATDAGVLYTWCIVRRTKSKLLGHYHEGKLMRVLQVPEEERFAAAPAFYRAVWGSRDDDVLLMNATRVWFLDLEGPELIVNTIDTSHTTTLFTSIDPSGAERHSEYLCLCTTDAVMWLDARDGQLVLSWEHMRHGETLEVRAMAGKVDTSEETVFLVRSLENQKATFLHVRESIEGIQSRRDPYDVLLLGQDTSQEPFTSTARRLIGLSSMFIEDSPTPLSLLLFLEGNGQLSCRLQQPTNSPHVAAETLGTNVKGRPKRTGPVTPAQLILHRHLLERDSQSDEDMVDGDILRDMFPPEEKTGDEQDIEDTSNKSYKRIKTGALWQNFCDAKNSAEAVFSLASLRSFLNDREELPDTGIFTLHEFLAMACESADSDDRCVRSDSLKSYTLGLSHDRVEKLQQFQDLLERLNAVLDRSDFRISRLRDTIFRITGEISLAFAPDTALESLEQGYLGGIELYSPDEPLAEVHQRQQNATFRLLCDLHVSATTLLSPTDDSAQHKNKDINISETLSRLSFSPPSKGTAPRTTFLKAMASAESSETTSITLQTLSSQWEIGSDPGQYVWPGKSNHRALDTVEDLPASLLPPPPVRNPTSNVPTYRLPRQSALFNSSPALHSLFTPNFGTGESLPIPNTPSQVHFEGDSQRQSQDFASSQIIQGPFGGRNGASFRRSLGKKRTIGF